MSLDLLLNEQLANWNVLYVKLHRFHWYVNGPEFFTLHTQFEAYYDSAKLVVDELAERMLTIGVKPLATMKQYLEVSQIKEHDDKLTGTEMVQELLNDYTLIVKHARQIISVCEGSDEETADLFRDKISELEKQMWMLRSYLGE